MLQELKVSELNNVNGGGAMDALFVGGGTMLVAWAPVVALTGVGAPIAIGMALTGSAAIIAGTGADVELIEY